MRSQLDINAGYHLSPAALSHSFVEGVAGPRHVRSNGRRWQRIEDGLHHAVEVTIDVGIPEVQHTEALAAQDNTTLPIGGEMCRHGVLLAIGVDDELRRQADEVYDIAADRRAPPEVIAAQLELAQPSPQPRFLRRETLAKSTCGGTGHG